jgi:hypothetical protein
MNWFRQNKFLGGLLVALALATLLAAYLLLHEMGMAGDEEARLETTMAEFSQLRSSAPFPNETNLKKTRAQVEHYRLSLGGLEEKLKAQTLPLVPLQPNEFQAQLRQAVDSMMGRAAAGKVQLPNNFFLGFDEYATSLPNPVAAPLLGQELRAVELLLGAIVDAHVDALSRFARSPLPEEKANPSPTPTPTTTRGGRVASANVPVTPVTIRAVEISFSASPAAARKALNQIASAKEQLFIIRSLEVKNQVDKGPKREGATAAPPAATTANGRPAAAPSVNFIVGSEHLNVAARIDIISLSSATQGP